jgi:PEP-CTERM motif-containing protein
LHKEYPPVKERVATLSFCLRLSRGGEFMVHRVLDCGIRVLILLAPLTSFSTAAAEPVTFRPRLVFNPGRPITGSVVLSTEPAILSGSVEVATGGIVPPGADLTLPEDIARSTQFSVSEGLFRFTTGVFTGTSGFEDRSFEFGPGEFEITGGIPELGVPVSSQLVSGEFRTFTYIPVPPIFLSVYNFLGSALTIHPALASLFGSLPPGNQFDFSGTLQGSLGPSSLERPFVVQTHSAHLFVQPSSAPIAPVPEPGTMLLVAGGLAAWTWRAARAQCHLLFTSRGI